MSNENTIDFITSKEVVIVGTCDMILELNTYCSNRHQHIIESLKSVINCDIFGENEDAYQSLTSVFIDKEQIWNLDLVCALNLLSIHQAINFLKLYDKSSIYSDSNLCNEVELIVTSLKSSKYLSLTEFKDYSDKRSIEQLLADINANENTTGLSTLCHGDIVSSDKLGYQDQPTDCRKDHWVLS